MRGPTSSSTTNWSSIGQPMAIVLVVLIIGASIYLWRMRYLRSRAAMITIAMTVLALIYFAMKASPV